MSQRTSCNYFSWVSMVFCFVSVSAYAGSDGLVLERGATQDELTLKWPSRVGQVFRVLESSDLQNWSSIANSIVGGPQFSSLPVNMSGPMKYFKAEAELNVPRAEILAISNPSLSGQVSVSIVVSPPSEKSIGLVELQVDGKTVSQKLASIAGETRLELPVDTFYFPNGPHQLQIKASSSQATLDADGNLVPEIGADPLLTSSVENVGFSAPRTVTFSNWAYVASGGKLSSSPFQMSFVLYGDKASRPAGAQIEILDQDNLVWYSGVHNRPAASGADLKAEIFESDLVRPGGVLAEQPLSDFKFHARFNPIQEAASPALADTEIPGSEDVGTENEPLEVSAAENDEDGDGIPNEEGDDVPPGFVDTPPPFGEIEMLGHAYPGDVDGSYSINQADPVGTTIGSWLDSFEYAVPEGAPLGYLDWVIGKYDAFYANVDACTAALYLYSQTSERLNAVLQVLTSLEATQRHIVEQSVTVRESIDELVENAATQTELQAAAEVCMIAIPIGKMYSLIKTGARYGIGVARVGVNRAIRFGQWQRAYVTFQNNVRLFQQSMKNGRITPKNFTEFLNSEVDLLTAARTGDTYLVAASSVDPAAALMAIPICATAGASAADQIGFRLIGSSPEQAFQSANAVVDVDNWMSAAAQANLQKIIQARAIRNSLRQELAQYEAEAIEACAPEKFFIDWTP